MMVLPSMLPVLTEMVVLATLGYLSLNFCFGYLSPLQLLLLYLQAYCIPKVSVL